MQVVFLDGGDNVFRVGEGRREVEQKALPRHQRVVGLPLGIVLAALVRLIQQNEPLAAVFIQAVIGQRVFLHIGEVVAAVVIHRFHIAQPGLARPPEFSQGSKIDVQAFLVKLLYGEANLLYQVFAGRKHENVVRRDLLALFKVAQILDDLHHDQGLAAAGRHPETHAVNQLIIVNGVSLRIHILRQNFEDGVSPLVPPVRFAFILFYSKGHDSGLHVHRLGKPPLASPVSLWCFAEPPGLLPLSVEPIQGPRCVLQRVSLIIIQSLAP